MPRPFVWIAVLCLVSAPLPVRAAEGAAGSGCTLRVESELFANGKSDAVARSLTLFRDGVTWDFLEIPPAGDGDGGMQLAEIVLHDPARERLVVVDPIRNVKTTVAVVRLERLGVSLAKWARGADDRLVRWAGGPDFDSGMQETDAGIELVGPRVRYAVAHTAAPSEESAAAYRRFADTAILLRALLHPGGVPPFPRLALNRRLEAARAIPTEVALEIEPKLGPISGRPERLKCVHKSHPRLLSSDLQRIDDAEAHVAAAGEVDLAAFMAPPATAAP